MTNILSLEDLKSPQNWLLVSEIFKSHQGEGPSCGQLATFIRLGGCNLHCHWCDTPYTWVFTDRQRLLHDGRAIYNPKHELKRMSLSAIADRLFDLRSELIVITGGEPLLQAERVARFIRLISHGLMPYRFEIETAGTVLPGELAQFDNVTFNVSLKLDSSGNELELRNVPEVIRTLNNCQSRFKFVITRDSFAGDLAEVERLRYQFGIYPNRIWLMPEGTTQLDQVSGIQQLMPAALSLGYNVSTRLHVLGYGNERGT